MKKIEMSSEFLIILRRFRRNRLSLLGSIIFMVFVFFAIFADFISPNDPYEMHLKTRLSGPSSRFPLGQDEFGRCILSRIIYGSRVSLTVGVLVVLISMSIGLSVGMISGYFGGFIDTICMRIVDALLAFPSFLLALAIMAVLGQNIFNVILALSLVGWTGVARLVRGEVLSIRERMYVVGAKAIGANDFYIILHYILPNVFPTVIIYGSLMMAGAILQEAGLSFLGMGVQPPVPSWGAMLSAGRAYLRSHPHISTFPGIAIFLNVLALNLIGDGLRDALDPWLKR